MIFLRHPQSVKLVFHHLYYHLPVSFLGVLLVALKRRIGSKLGVKPRKEKERILYPLMSSILSYDIRMTTIIILVLIIILYPHQYLLMKMKWMYLTLYSVNTLTGFLFFFFIPGEGGARVMLSGMSGSSLPQRHYCLGERTSVAFQKSRV